MKKISLLLAFVLSIGFVFGQNQKLQLPEKPQTGNRVVDLAGVLSQDQIKQLNDKIYVVQQGNLFHFRILVVKDIKEYGYDDLFTIGQDVFKKWQIGQAGADNGILLIHNLTTGKKRLVVDNGAGDVLTDADSKRILVNQRPYFEQKQYFDAYMGIITQVYALFHKKVSDVPARQQDMTKAHQEHQEQQSEMDWAPIKNFGGGAVVIGSIIGLFYALWLLILSLVYSLWYYPRWKKSTFSALTTEELQYKDGELTRATLPKWMQLDADDVDRRFITEVKNYIQTIELLKKPKKVKISALRAQFDALKIEINVLAEKYLDQLHDLQIKADGIVQEAEQNVPKLQKMLGLIEPNVDVYLSAGYDVPKIIIPNLDQIAHTDIKGMIDRHIAGLQQAVLDDAVAFNHVSGVYHSAMTQFCNSNARIKQANETKQHILDVTKLLESTNLLILKKGFRVQNVGNYSSLLASLTSIENTQLVSNDVLETAKNSIKQAKDFVSQCKDIMTLFAKNESDLQIFDTDTKPQYMNQLEKADKLMSELRTKIPASYLSQYKYFDVAELENQLINAKNANSLEDQLFEKSAKIISSIFASFEELKMFNAEGPLLPSDFEKARQSYNSKRQVLDVKLSNAINACSDSDVESSTERRLSTLQTKVEDIDSLVSQSIVDWPEAAKNLDEYSDEADRITSRAHQDIQDAEDAREAARLAAIAAEKAKKDKEEASKDDDDDDDDDDGSGGGGAED